MKLLAVPVKLTRQEQLSGEQTLLVYFKLT
jgi:hypothetical protein